jgi:hypothetical protein
VGDVAVTIAVMDEGMASEQSPETDKWPVQLKETFGFGEELGFRVVDSGTYRLRGLDPVRQRLRRYPSGQLR